MLKIILHFMPISSFSALPSSYIIIEHNTYLSFNGFEGSAGFNLFNHEGKIIHNHINNRLVLSFKFY